MHSGKDLKKIKQFVKERSVKEKCSKKESIEKKDKAKISKHTQHHDDKKFPTDTEKQFDMLRNLHVDDFNGNDNLEENIVLNEDPITTESALPPEIQRDVESLEMDQVLASMVNNDPILENFVAESLQQTSSDVSGRLTNASKQSSSCSDFNQGMNNTPNMIKRENEVSTQTLMHNLGQFATSTASINNLQQSVTYPYHSQAQAINQNPFNHLHPCLTDLYNNHAPSELNTSLEHIKAPEMPDFSLMTNDQKEVAIINLDQQFKSYRSQLEFAHQQILGKEKQFQTTKANFNIIVRANVMAAKNAIEEMNKPILEMEYRRMKALNVFDDLSNCSPELQYFEPKPQDIENRSDNKEMQIVLSSKSSVQYQSPRSREEKYIGKASHGTVRCFYCHKFGHLDKFCNVRE